MSIVIEENVLLEFVLRTCSSFTIVRCFSHNIISKYCGTRKSKRLIKRKLYFQYSVVLIILAKK